MFEALLSTLVNRRSIQSQRAAGVAFFKVAKTLYRIESAEYLGINIPLASRHFAHCNYSDTQVTHYITGQPVCIDSIIDPRLTDPGPIDWNPNDGPAEWSSDHSKRRTVTFRLRPRFGETAIFGITVEVATGWEKREQLSVRELRVLANYFHSHVLRINGQDFEHEMLISAREIDCLKWTAAGKTAWEASVILGISERTVRAHLNAAREKLNCATTTQAVAKAIADQLIDV